MSVQVSLLVITYPVCNLIYQQPGIWRALPAEDPQEEETIKVNV